MRNLLLIALIISTLGGCVTRGGVGPTVSQLNPTDLDHFSYLAKINAEDLADAEPYAETVAEAKETVPEENSDRQKTSASFFTWNENMEQSEMN